MNYRQNPSFAFKLFYFPITRIILGIAACLAIVVSIKDFITKPLLLSLIPAEDIAISMVNLFSVAILITAYHLVFRFYENRQVKELSPKLLGRELTFGLLLGILVIAFEFLILYLLGNYSILGFQGFSIFVKPLSTLILMALIEELFFRGILYRILEEWTGTILALVISSVLFQIPHFWNPNESLLGALLGVLLGLATGIMYTYTKRVWLPFAFHLGWNFAQLIFGSNLTGIKEFGVMLEGSLSGPVWLSGGAMGIEGSVLSVLAMGSIFIIYYKKVYSQNGLVPPSRKL